MPRKKSEVSLVSTAEDPAVGDSVGVVKNGGTWDRPGVITAVHLLDDERGGRIVDVDVPISEGVNQRFTQIGLFTTRDYAVELTTPTRSGYAAYWISEAPAA